MKLSKPKDIHNDEQIIGVVMDSDSIDKLFNRDNPNLFYKKYPLMQPIQNQHYLPCGSLFANQMYLISNAGKVYAALESNYQFANVRAIEIELAEVPANLRSRIQEELETISAK